MSKKEAGDSKAVDWNGLDDDILIKAFLKGDQTAFEVLFRKYRDLVGRLAFSIVKEEAAVNDIVQEVFLLVFRHVSKFRYNSSFKTWIYRITVNESLRQSAKAKRWQPLPEGDLEPSLMPSTMVVLDKGESPERILIDGQQKALVHRALENIKHHHRVILVLYYIEDQSVQEISEILQIPEGSVKSRLFYARESLRKLLDPILARNESQPAKNIHAL